MVMSKKIDEREGTSEAAKPRPKGNRGSLDEGREVPLLAFPPHLTSCTSVDIPFFDTPTFGRRNCASAVDKAADINGHGLSPLSESRSFDASRNL
jgi:hypothetical protein